MLELYMFVFGAFLGGSLAYGAGRNFAKYPTEEEMIRRLIDARVERKLRAITKTEVEAEVENAAERLVR